jgi:alkylresorcinol/alkylpyrone synthase
MAYIAATASCFPANYYKQSDLTSAICKLWSPSKLARTIERFHKNTTVKGRYMALPIEEYGNFSGFKDKNKAWLKVALDLGQGIFSRIFEIGKISPQEISQIVFTSVTGIAVPSIDARLMNHFSFSPHVKRVPLFGLGCMGGCASISRSGDYLRGQPEDAVLILAVELCSLTFQKEDQSVANIIASGLFGDGAAGVLMLGDNHPLVNDKMPRVVDSLSIFFPETEHVMGWEIMDSGLKVILSPDVVEIAGTKLQSAIVEFLARNELSISEISHWIAHPGGPKVIQAMEKGIGLPPEAFEISRKNLAEVGNISSASVLLILEETIKQCQPQAGSYGLMMAMGPAFSAELVLLRW